MLPQVLHESKCDSRAAASTVIRSEIVGSFVPLTYKSPHNFGLLGVWSANRGGTRRASVDFVRIRSVLVTGFMAAVLTSPLPAGAATTCQTFEGDIIVQTDETDSAPVTLRVVDEELFVDGVSCGQSSTNVVTVIDVGEPSADHIVVDLTTPFVMDGDVVFLNLVLEPDASGTPDRVTVIGGDGVDNVELFYNVLTDSGNTFFAGGDSLRGLVEFTPGVRMEIRLGRGADRFTMPADSNGRSFGGELLVRGGPGPDVMQGGPGPQEFRGGPGADTLLGGPGRDLLLGNSGRDTIRGNKGRDTIWGGKGRDTVHGGRHADTFYMDDGRVDVVNGGRGKSDICICDEDDIVRRASRSEG